MTNYPFNVAVGQSATVNTQGSFLYYESASAGGVDSSIKVKSDKGDEFVLKVGQGAQVKFTRLYISNNLGQGAITGNLVLADAGFIDHRVVGTVEVLDGGKNRVMAGISFCGNAQQSGAAGQYPIVQLWNPAGSGKNAIVERLIVASSVADTPYVGYLNGALATVLNPPINKKLGVAIATVMQMRSDIPAAFALPAVQQMIGLFLPVSQSLLVPSIEPIVVPPGCGLVVAAGSNNRTINATFDYFEDPL